MGARHAGRHGPIALVDEGELVVFIMPLERGRDVLHAKVRFGIEEVKSRVAVEKNKGETGQTGGCK